MEADVWGGEAPETGNQGSWDTVVREVEPSVAIAFKRSKPAGVCCPWDT